MYNYVFYCPSFDQGKMGGGIEPGGHDSFAPKRAQVCIMTKVGNSMDFSVVSRRDMEPLDTPPHPPEKKLVHDDRSPSAV